MHRLPSRSLSTSAAVLIAVSACAAMGVTSAQAGSAPVSSESPSRADPDSAYSAVVLADHPFAYWRLGDVGATLMADASGNGRDGQYAGHPQLGEPGLIAGDSDTSVRFHGGGDSAEWDPGSQSYRGAFSVEAWVRPSSDVGNHVIVSTRGSVDYSFDVKLSDYKRRGVRVDLGNGSAWYLTRSFTYDWVKGGTYYVAAVATDQSLVVYVDGQRIGVKHYCTETCRLPLLYGPTHPPQVAMTHDAEYFRGRIDEVALYTHPLTDQQIATHYAAGS